MSRTDAMFVARGKHLCLSPTFRKQTFEKVAVKSSICHFCHDDIWRHYKCPKTVVLRCSGRRKLNWSTVHIFYSFLSLSLLGGLAGKNTKMCHLKQNLERQKGYTFVDSGGESWGGRKKTTALTRDEVVKKLSQLLCWFSPRKIQWTPTMILGDFCPTKFVIQAEYYVVIKCGLPQVHYENASDELFAGFWVFRQNLGNSRNSQYKVID